MAQNETTIAYVHFDEPDRRYGLNAFVIGDEVYRTGGVVASAAVGGPASWYGLPRTWGVEIYARF